MRFVALLRGINVGGKNKVDMGTLREIFERVGAKDVRTYINSGNVVFSDDRDVAALARVLEDAIEETFGKRHGVLLRDIDAIREVVSLIPDSWTTDKTMRTRVLFLWEHIDSPDLVDQLPVRDGIDDIKYSPGAIVWRVEADKLTRSGMGRLASSNVYSGMTARNSNTVRRLAEMMEEASL